VCSSLLQDTEMHHQAFAHGLRQVVAQGSTFNVCCACNSTQGSTFNVCCACNSIQATGDTAACCFPSEATSHTATLIRVSVMTALEGDDVCLQWTATMMPDYTVLAPAGAQDADACL